MFLARFRSLRGIHEDLGRLSALRSGIFAMRVIYLCRVAPGFYSHSLKLCMYLSSYHSIKRTLLGVCTSYPLDSQLPS